MDYDPFHRGSFPAAVQTALFPTEEGSLQATEIWSPARSQYIGLDTCPDAQDRYEVKPGQNALRQSAVRDALFAKILQDQLHKKIAGLIAIVPSPKHHRRQLSALACHLASHGYLVFACDFPNRASPQKQAQAISLTANNIATLLGSPLPIVSVIASNKEVQVALQLSTMLNSVVTLVAINPSTDELTQPPKRMRIVPILGIDFSNAPPAWLPKPCSWYTIASSDVASAMLTQDIASAGAGIITAHLDAFVRGSMPARHILSHQKHALAKAQLSPATPADQTNQSLPAHK